MKSKSTTVNWFIDSSEIKPGHSAMLGGNAIAFYAIHYIAVFVIAISLVSCVIVITRILINLKSQKERTKMDFSVRFPFYLALADLLWGLSHLVDHTYLLATETYPKDSFTNTALSINIWFFLGYQQLMHASLAAYTYLRVVRLRILDLGLVEWRLHLFCISFMGITTILFYCIGAFGCSGYWFLENRNSVSGKILGFTIAIVCTSNAFCTTVGYYMIARKVNEQKRNLRNSLTTNPKIPDKGYHSTATQCLTTFVRNSACLYCPFAVLAWACWIQGLFGVLEPLTVFILVVISNSSGWANALGYFRNEGLKKVRLNSAAPTKMLELDVGIASSGTDTTPVTSYS